MIRCPYCGSHNVIALPLGDYLCLDCEEQFYKGERSSSVCRKISGRALSLIIKKGPLLVKVAKNNLPVLLRGAKVFF